MRTFRSLVPALVWTVVIFLVSTVPGDRFPAVSLFPHQDKVAHLFLYGTLGVCLGAGRRWGGDRLPHLALLAGGWLYGALDEWYQSFIPRRSPDPLDWLVDVAGVTVGYVLVLSLIPFRGPGPGGASPGAQTDRSP